MTFTTNLYCDILGYDAVQFDVYILTFSRKIEAVVVNIAAINSFDHVEVFPSTAELKMELWDSLKRSGYDIVCVHASNNVAASRIGVE
jgi:hypothetical protein